MQGPKSPIRERRNQRKPPMWSIWVRMGDEYCANLLGDLGHRPRRIAEVEEIALLLLLQAHMQQRIAEHPSGQGGPSHAHLGGTDLVAQRSAGAEKALRPTNQEA
jgi:hypothetical protein